MKILFKINLTDPTGPSLKSAIFFAFFIIFNTYYLFFYWHSWTKFCWASNLHVG